jgi:hypothetical protein
MMLSRIIIRSNGFGIRIAWSMPQFSSNTGRAVLLKLAFRMDRVCRKKTELSDPALSRYDIGRKEG